MTDSEKFSPYSFNPSDSKKSILSIKGGVIKDRRIQVSDPKTIESSGISEDGYGKSKSKAIHTITENELEPIIENEQVIGIKIQCSCGKMSRIFFEYE